MSRWFHPMVIADLLVLVICAAALRSAWYELFVELPGVHVARWPGPWSTPKTAALVVLVMALVGLVAALLLVVVLRDRGLRTAVRAVEIGAVVAIIGAYLVWMTDFFSSAGRFG
jgi:hypothetical protein